MQFTAIIQEGENGWLVGQLEELPAVIEQGKNVEELKANLLSALNFYLETQREQTKRGYVGQKVTRELLLVA
ncbi:type II toxin-antitoxin system HicB family antitoxin [Hymenobacter gummosus]|uniref:type II toxin-antitoxin system HicB family antitoxin n=1 Tax=Hymenobacter gummosus TaxID=1776032 RepID=UPI001AA0049C|nr:type II toxin-antitoxin system HicB family antitoxin [Hymenobacter gummosus]